MVAEAVAAPTESIPDSGEPVLLGPPIRYLPLDPPAGRDPITTQGTIEESTMGDGVAECTITYAVDAPMPNRVALVRYDAQLAPSVAVASAMFRDSTAPGADSTGLTSFGEEILTTCDRADECAQLFATSNTENVTMVAHILRARNLVVVVMLQAQGAEGVSWLTEEMPYYVSLVMDQVPPG